MTPLNAPSLQPTDPGVPDPFRVSSLLRPTLVGLLLLLMATSCSGKADGAGTARLQGNEPAPETGAPAAFGRQVAIGAIRLTVSDPRPGPAVSLSPDQVGVVAVTIRSENPTNRKQLNPHVAVYCAGEQHGSWFAISEWEPGATLEAGRYAAGRAVLGMPVDCANAVIRAANYMGPQTDVVTWPLPDDVVRAVAGG